MTDGVLIFDAVIAATVVAVAVGALIVKDQFQSIVLFIVFGLLTAIIWCRLDSVDVALAEAAIGAGLTGALLLNTLAALGGARKDANIAAMLRIAGPATRSVAADGEGRRFFLPLPVTALLVVVPTVLLAYIAAPLATADARRIEVGPAMPETGAINPVTAVLLNLRAYDTLLEVAVLVVAAFAVVALRPAPTTARELPAVGPVLRSFVGYIVPLIVLVAAYLLWIGSKAPGGAFQSGALACAAGVLLLVTGARAPGWLRGSSSGLLLIGIIVFLLAGLLPIAWHGRFLEYRLELAETLILMIETALAVSIAWILVLLFAGGTLEQNSNTAARAPHRP